MIWTSIVIAAVAFLAVVWFGRYLKRNRKGYPLDPPEQGPEFFEKARLKLPKKEGVPITQTADGIRWLEIAAGTCPHCKDPTARFRAGPEGGMSQNIQCVTCDWWFNVTVFPDGSGIAADIGFKDDRGRNL